MSASGLIYAAIAIMWAAVLIPMWLRNHESATENRSAERFGQAMRVLSRKESGSDAGHDSHVGSSHEAVAGTNHEPAEQERRQTRQQPTRRQAPTPSRPKVTLPQRVARGWATRQQRASARSSTRRPKTIAQRRARTLGVLAGLALVMVLLSVITPVPWWAAVPFLLLMAAFVVHLRVQARHKLARSRPATTRTTRTRPTARRATQKAAAGSQARQAREAPSSEQTLSSDESGVVQGPSRAVVVERKGEGASSDGSAEADDEVWRPEPLPLPTYVTAPKAVRPIKVIDLTTPGAWSSGRLLEDDVAEEDLLAAQVADEELDALIGEEAAPASETSDDGRRAVGD